MTARCLAEFGSRFLLAIRLGAEALLAARVWMGRVQNTCLRAA